MILTVLALLGIGYCALPTDLGPRASPGELSRRDAWVRAHLRRPAAGSAATARAAVPSGLVVLANHGDIIRNARGDGRPLRIGEQPCDHGLLCHAPSHVVVRLPGPASRFTAGAGIDANAGGGSVVFAVRLAGRDAWRSGVVRFGEPAAAVDVDLAGASEFSLVAGDAGDGIACDHALWSEAAVTLQDGRVVRLSDLPAVRHAPPERAAATPAFSFWYGGRPSDELLPHWEHARSARSLGRGKRETTDTYRDPETGLQVRCVFATYADYPVVEWTVHVRNTGSADTPVIEALQALDVPFTRGASGEFVLHRWVGSPCQENDFQPLHEVLMPGEARRVSAAGGRPTNSDLCYFNLEWPGAGVIVALGWPGQWTAAFERTEPLAVRITAGQELTRFALRPGEEVRTPLVALQFWQDRDWVDSQNVWRRWMMAHNVPRVGERPVGTHYGGCWGNPLPNAAEEIAQATGAMADGVTLDYWFIDAGWYPNDGSWTNVGTWEPDPIRFPRGLREVADVLHARGTKFIVWFEPERVTAGSWLAANHPEWLLGGALLNLGDPAVRNWLVAKLDTLIKDGGIDVFRSDFNIDPLAYWRAHDADDRLGMTENLYVQGYLAVWDGLAARNPGLWFDSCASGGRRNDLETLRRAVPLLRSDYAVVRFDRAGAAGQQAQTYGLSFWMPVHGTGAPCSEPYVWRSSFCPAFRMGWDARDADRDPERLRRAVREFRQVEPNLTGDYYPLTAYSLAPDAWMAYQFDSPEAGTGVVQAFRREQCASDTLRVRLRGLRRSAAYELVDLDGGPPQRVTGAAAMEQGIVVTLPAAPSAALLLYRRVRD